MRISVFENLYANKPFTTTVSELIERFRTTDKHRISGFAGMSKAQLDKAKKRLPVACFAGTFDKRSRQGLIKASGVLVLDFDGVTPSDCKELLKSDANCLCAFTSPSGKGVKALMLIDEVKTDHEYKFYFEHFRKQYPELDESGKDISRACFFAYDPELNYNPDAEVLRLEMPTEERKKVTKKIDAVMNDYGIANKACEIIRHAQEGERHTKILRASRLLGGFVASGRITYDEAERILLQEADKVNDDWKDNQNAVRDGLQNGMQDPINEKALEAELKKEETLIKYGKIYYTLTDKKEEVLDLYYNGQQKGYEIGMKSVDEKISLKLGTTSYLYGAPFTGKTQWWFWYLVCQSFTHGLKHAIFSPETGSAKEIFADLLQVVARADFYKTYNKQMPEKLRDWAMKFVDAHFIVLDPSHKVITHEDFFNYIDEMERVYNVKIHTATIDPFNEFRQDLGKFSNRQDLYLESVLSEVRENARTNNRHNCIITHIQDQQVINQNGIRYYPMPTYREIAGGQAWSRKGMQMIGFWRPAEGLCDADGVPYPSNTTVVGVQKSKPKGVGAIGNIEMLYNVNTHSYTDMNGNEPAREMYQESKKEEKYNPNIEEDEEWNTKEEAPF